MNRDSNVLQRIQKMYFDYNISPPHLENSTKNISSTGNIRKLKNIQKSKQFIYSIKFYGNKENDPENRRKLKHYQNLYVFKNKHNSDITELVKNQALSQNLENLFSRDESRFKTPPKECEIPKIPDSKIKPQTSHSSYKKSGSKATICTTFTVINPNPVKIKTNTCDKLKLFLEDLNNMHSQIEELKQKRMDVTKFRVRNTIIRKDSNKRSIFQNDKTKTHDTSMDEISKTRLPSLRKMDGKRGTVAEAVYEYNSNTVRNNDEDKMMSRIFTEKNLA